MANCPSCGRFAESDTNPCGKCEDDAGRVEEARAQVVVHRQQLQGIRAQDLDQGLPGVARHLVDQGLTDPGILDKPSLAAKWFHDHGVTEENAKALRPLVEELLERAA